MVSGFCALAEPKSSSGVQDKPAGNRSGMDDHSEKPQIAAATAQALAALRDEIEKAQLTSRLTVAEYVRQTGGSSEIRLLIEQNQSHLAPRWLDADTCQIQMEVSAEKVVQMLQRIATSHPRESSLSAGEIAKETASWKNRTFSGTGSSTAFSRLVSVPAARATGNWSSVNGDDRKRALETARVDAMNKVTESLLPVPLANGKTIGDALGNLKVKKALTDWLESRPVVHVEYRADMQVELTLQGSADGCLAALRRAIMVQSEVAFPVDEKGWEAVRSGIQQRMVAIVGRGGINSPAKTEVKPVNPGVSQVTNPNLILAEPGINAGTRTVPSTGRSNIQPVQGSPMGLVAYENIILIGARPAWANEQRESRSVSKSKDSKLKAAREAETIARLKLQREINLLTLEDGSTIEQAQKKNPKFESAIRDALNKAKSTVDYDDPDGVGVRLRFELADLWDALNSVR